MFECVDSFILQSLKLTIELTDNSLIRLYVNTLFCANGSHGEVEQNDGKIAFLALFGILGAIAIELILNGMGGLAIDGLAVGWHGQWNDLLADVELYLQFTVGHGSGKFYDCFFGNRETMRARRYTCRFRVSYD